MRLAALLLVSFMVSGCASDDASAPQEAADPGRTSEDPDDVVLVVDNTPTVITVDGSLDLAAHPAPGQDANVIADPYQLDVADGVRQIYLELVWPETVGGLRQGMTLRAISDTEHWFYGGSGTGTDDDPDVIHMDEIHDSYEVVPVADTVVYDQPYTVYISLFDGKMPDSYTAVPA